MPVITIATSKGGAGKTTVCRLFASAIAERYPAQKITIIDTDPNQHSAAWFDIGHAPNNIAIIRDSTQHTVIDDIDKASADDWVFVDVEGIASVTMQDAINCADFTLLICQPSEDDVSEIFKVVSRVRKQEKVLRRKIAHAVLMNRTRASGSTRLNKEILKDFENAENEIPHLKNSLNERVAFQNMRTEGCSLNALKQNNKDSTQRKSIDSAIKNLNEVLDEFLEILNNE